MRKRTPLAIVAILTACGAAATSNNTIDTADASAQAQPQNGYDPHAGLDDARAAASWEQSGGIPGCFDPSLSGRERAVAERLGGVPCEASATDQAGASGGDGWPGSYDGRFDGGEGIVTISAPTSAGYHQVEVEVVEPGGCSGHATATARPNGNRMSLEIPVENNQRLCAIDLVRRGSTISVSEEGCGELHGMSCAFSGSVTRRGQIAAMSRQSTPTRSPSWIVGTWVPQGGDCDGPIGITYFADGYYATHMDAGRWQLSGDTLTHTATETYRAGDESSRRPIRNPQPSRSQIVSRDRASFTHRSPNGAARLEKCP